MKAVKIRRIVVTAVVVLAAYLLQCTIFPSLEIAGIKPNLMLIVTASFGFMRGPREGMFVGLASGMLIDVQSGDMIGFYALIYLVAGYVNMLDCILEIYFDRYDFFRHTGPEKNPYISSRFYSIVLETVELHTDHVRRRLQLKYSPKKIAGFVCFGMFGFINECRLENTPLEQIRKEAEKLLTDILRSGVLTEKEGHEKMEAMGLEPMTSRV